MSTEAVLEAHGNNNLLRESQFTVLKKNEKAKRSNLNSGSITLISAIYHECRKHGMTN